MIGNAEFFDISGLRRAESVSENEEMLKQRVIKSYKNCHVVGAGMLS